MTKQKKTINNILNLKPSEYDNSGGFIMPKITSSNTKSLFVSYIVKIIISSVISIFVLATVFSFITLKLDLDLKALEYFSVAICALSSVIISYVSISGFKNNFLLLSLLSVFPLAVFSIINFCVSGQGSFAFELVKIAVIFVFAMCVAIFKSSRKLR